MAGLLPARGGCAIQGAQMPTLFLIVFVDLVGFGLVIPLLPFYALRFAASPQEVTVLLAIYSLMQLFAAPLLGRLSDRVGRRPVLMVSMAASVLAYVWIGSATALWMLFGARALAGACAGNIAAAQAYIADITKPEDRAKGMGLIGAAFGLGFIIGPARDQAVERGLRQPHAERQRADGGRQQRHAARQGHDQEPNADQRKTAKQKSLLSETPGQRTDEPALQDRREDADI